MDQSRIGLAQTFAHVARVLHAEDDIEATLHRTTELAVEVIEGCDHAGVSLIQGRRITTAAASDVLSRQVDAIQYEVDEGPCLDAMREHESFRIHDLGNEDRWPTFCRRAVEETGVAAMMSYRLFDEEDTMGALNLYSRTPGAFDNEGMRPRLVDNGRSMRANGVAGRENDPAPRSHRGVAVGSATRERTHRPDQARL